MFYHVKYASIIFLLIISVLHDWNHFLLRVKWIESNWFK